MDEKFTSALQLLEEKEAKSNFSTGSPELDKLIGDGIEPGAFYLFYGDIKSGIDRFIHHLVAEALYLGGKKGKRST